MKRGIEPRTLFPAIAILALALIWGATFAFLRTHRADLERASQVSTREILETYEAQVIRSLDQIERTLAVVTYAHDTHPQGRLLGALGHHELLPPGLLFTVVVTDRDGQVIESTDDPPMGNLAGRDYFEAQRERDAGVALGRPADDAGAAARVGFSRRLTARDGSFDGIAAVDVDASYFVSGYEPTRMGTHGALALLDREGRILARRSGDELGIGGAVSAATQAAASAEGDQIVVHKARNPRDGVERWTAVRPVYGAPLAVVAGLSVDEQRAIGRRTVRQYLIAATILSLVVVGFLAGIGRQAHLLMMSHRRETELHREHAERVEYIAYHDGLTGLPNRSLFSRLLSQNVNDARRQGRTLALAFLDIDHFKAINDTLGHEAGDELLREVANRLRSSVRENDTVARLSGDEFVVLLPDIGGRGSAAAVARKILDELAQPFMLVGHEVRVTASIGISRCPQDGNDEQSLKKHADVAMYQAKALGRNTFHIHEDEAPPAEWARPERRRAG